MARRVLSEVLVFLLPFAVFAAYLALQRRNPLQVAAWSASLSWLVIVGLACVVASFVASGVIKNYNTGHPYVPTHLENGRVVPGQFPATVPRPETAPKPVPTPAPETAPTPTPPTRNPSPNWQYQPRGP